MCLATVYLQTKGQREQVMEDVAWIQAEDDTLRLVTFLGESRRFQSKIMSVDLLNGAIVLEAESA